MGIELRVVDTDAKGVERHAFRLSLPSTRATLRGLIQARIVLDMELADPDYPERHPALVQPLRARETGNEIELFTPPVVDVEAQIKAALRALEDGELGISLDGVQLGDPAEQLDLSHALELRFLRYGMIIGG